MIERDRMAKSKRGFASNPELAAKVGKIGGSKKVPKGFAAMDKDRLREISSKGGKSGKENYS